MCQAPSERSLFFAKGREKGWSEERIERAWAAHEQQRAREDARVLNTTPAPPKPLAVGERVRIDHEVTYWGGKTGEILAIDGMEAWVRVGADARGTFPVRRLARVAENACA